MCSSITSLTLTAVQFRCCSLGQRQFRQCYIFNQHLRQKLWWMYSTYYKFQWIKKETATTKVKESQSLGSYAEACDRAQFSDRATALPSTYLFENYGLITRDNAEKKWLAKNKVRGARTVARTALTVSQIVSQFSSLYFDGRK